MPNFPEELANIEELKAFPLLIDNEKAREKFEKIHSKREQDEKNNFTF